MGRTMKCRKHELEVLKCAECQKARKKYNDNMNMFLFGFMTGGCFAGLLIFSLLQRLAPV